MLWMILACVIPLVIVLLLPLFGIKNNYTVFIAIGLMIATHLSMIRVHEHGSDKKSDSKDKQN